MIAFPVLVRMICVVIHIAINFHVLLWVYHLYMQNPGSLIACLRKCILLLKAWMRFSDTFALWQLWEQVSCAIDCGNLETAKEKIQSLFVEDNCCNPFKDLETQYLQEKWYKTHFNLGTLWRVLGSSYAIRNYGSKSKRVRKEDCVYDVNLLKPLHVFSDVGM